MKKKERKYEITGTALVPNPHVSSDKKMGKAFLEYVKKISHKANGRRSELGGMDLDRGHYGSNGPYEDVYDFPMTHAQTTAFIELFSDIKKVFNEVKESEYLRGVSEGKRLLILMNNGGLTMDQFDKELGDKYNSNGYED